MVSRSANAKPVDATNTFEHGHNRKQQHIVDQRERSHLADYYPTCTAKRPTANTSSAAKWVVRAISTSSAQVSTSNNTELSDA